MTNGTICNLFVDAVYIEIVTEDLSDLSVVCKKIGSIYRLQVLCDYVGVTSTHYQIHYYDYIEKDFLMVEIGLVLVRRATIFSKDLLDVDFMD